MAQDYYAHSPPNASEAWEPLAKHLHNVAIGDSVLGGALTFCQPFGLGELGRVAGLLHDIGKASAEFQRRIGAGEANEDGFSDPHRDEIFGRVDHSTAGARVANVMGLPGKLLAFAIAGHHAGLPNYHGDFGGGLRKRLDPDQYGIPNFDRVAIPESVDPADWPKLKPIDPADADLICLDWALMGRMVFSALVDADSLWTGRFYGTPIEDLVGPTVDFASFADRLQRHLNSKPSDGSVNKVRRGVLEQCLVAAREKPWFYSLHVPTGGGKTFASMMFAARHAAANNLNRIIYAIPLTTIIEQTASQFREVFGDALVTEHHSNVDPDDAHHNAARRLATENFDAPLIVTTNVQILETLFAASRSKCRKLHRIAGSVLIFDEVQTLPVNLLRPTLMAMRLLVERYGCTIVLCSATQPAITWRDEFTIGLRDVRPIIADPITLHRQMQRVSVERIGRRDVADLATELSDHSQALCIVNTRRHALDLVDAMDDAPIHLSTSMCPAHRRVVVASIRDRLRKGQPCRVVSTTVMEAGVDVDFPVVYRAVSGIDSITQAAGRCNREGRLDLGRVFVFDYDRSKYRAPDLIRDGIAAFGEIVDDHADDLLGPECVEAYFRQLFWMRGGESGEGWDQGVGGSVMECFAGKISPRAIAFQYEDAAKRYRLIPDEQRPVVVPYRGPGGGSGQRWIDEIQAIDESAIDAAWLRHWDRKSRPFAVGVFPHTLSRMLTSGTAAEFAGRCVLMNAQAYDDRVGLRPDIEGIGTEQMVW